MGDICLIPSYAHFTTCQLENLVQARRHNISEKPFGYPKGLYDTRNTHPKALYDFRKNFVEHENSQNFSSQ